MKEAQSTIVLVFNRAYQGVLDLSMDDVVKR